MNDVVWVLVAKIVLVALLMAIVYPFRLAVQKWMPDGKLKRFLLISWN